MAGRKLLRRPERRESILAAGAKAFVRGGFAATSMDDVATQAGVTKMIVYQHFASKEELYRALLDRARTRLREASGPDPARPDTILALVRAARQAPEEFILLLRQVPREPAFAAYAEEFETRRIRFAEQAMEGVVDDPVMRAWLARMAVRIVLDGIVEWLEVGDPARDEEFARQLLAGVTAFGRPQGPVSVRPAASRRRSP